MAIPRKLPIDFKLAFPFGAFMVGEITPVRDYDRSTADKVVQATDPETGVPLWGVDIVDADPEVNKSNRTMTVKVQAKVQPVLERAEGMPFTPVEFTELTATPYVDDNGNFARLAWSLRAKGVSNAAVKQTRANEKAA